MSNEQELLDWYHKHGYTAAAAEFLHIWAHRGYRFHDWDVDAILRHIRRKG